MEFLRDFKDINKNDASIAGGKGASLGEMRQAGFPVPDGFVILSSAFEKFLKEAKLNIKIDSILNSVDHKEIGSVENASKKIRSLILEATIPEEIRNKTEKFFKKLDTEFVAVRSSATAEDSESAAWAGQLESYLNTTSPILLENIKKCWASLFLPRAIFYRFEKNLRAQKISVAVVVQKMVKSRKSGVVFSVHPVTQDKNQLIIEASFGLGEDLVSGKITPDSYVVEKHPRRIIDKSIQGQNPVLSDAEIIELSELVLRIERHFDLPCDIEWACQSGKFYIVQCRPITTLSRPSFIRKFQKFFSREVPLIVMEYWHKGEYEELYKILDNATHFNPLFIRNKSGITDVYYDMNNPDTALEPLFDCFKKDEGKFDVIAKEFEIKQKKVLELLADFDMDDFSKLFNLIAQAWGYLPVWEQIGSADREDIRPDMAKRSYKLRDGFQQVEYKAGDCLLAAVKEKYPALKSYADVISAQEVLNNQVPDLKELNGRKNGFIFFENRILANISRDKFSKEYQVILADDLLTIGEFDPRSTLILESKMILKKKIDTDPFEASMCARSWSQGLENELGRGYKAVVINSDGEYFVDSESNDKIAEILKFKKIGDAFGYIKKMRDLKNDLTVKIKNKDLSDASQKFSDLHTYFFIASRISENLYKKSNIADKKIIDEWLKDNTLFEPLRLYGKTNSQNSPGGEWSVIFNNGEVFEFDKKLAWHEEETGKSDDLISGKTAYPGFVEGKARLIVSIDELNKVQEGEVLVTHMTSPEFVPVLKKVAAIITDEGGITSHAAIISRELKKPCIIGTKNASKKIKSGDKIEVDATNGSVKILCTHRATAGQ